MDSPSPGKPVRVAVDRQGRLVLPQWLRRRLVTTPGEVTLCETPDGILLSPVAPAGSVEEPEDGMPRLRLGRPVSNDEVLAAIDEERAGR
jgi:bifunctional DNA-binding transcriptional regulator/antitoxin component of YhaV-PrlF toxin-antitoxin module